MNDNNKIKILLIDNDEMMRIYFRDIFWIHGKNEQYEILMASSIKDVEDKIFKKELFPDSIFLEMMIPTKGDNNDKEDLINRSLLFVKRIKEDKELSSIKIIIFSSQKDKKIEEEFRKLDIDGYLIKGELMPKEIIDFVDKIYESNN